MPSPIEAKKVLSPSSPTAIERAIIKIYPMLNLDSFIKKLSFLFETFSSLSFEGKKEIIPKTINDEYVTISKIKCKELFSTRPIELPNKIAIPWLKNEPRATPIRIVDVCNLEEKDSTSNWVLSPNSDTKTNKKAISKGYKNII